jgi:hypothetical protein
MPPGIRIFWVSMGKNPCLLPHFPLDRCAPDRNLISHGEAASFLCLPCLNIEPELLKTKD